MNPLEKIQAKCEQYWNEPNICMEEIHSVLSIIHLAAEDAREEMTDLLTYLEKKEDWISALESAGVDNWVGYDFACETMREWHDEW